MTLALPSRQRKLMTSYYTRSCGILTSLIKDVRNVKPEVSEIIKGMS